MASAPAFEGLTHEATAPAVTAGQPSLIHPGTWMAVSVAAGSVGLSLVDDPMWWILAVPLSTLALLMVAVDSAVGSPRKRDSPEQAINLYAEAIKRSKWTKAWACVHSDAALDAHRLPELYEMDLSPHRVDLTTSRGFKGFWKSITQTSHGRVKRLYKCTVMMVPGSSDVRSAHVYLAIEHYPSWVHIGFLAGLLPGIILIVMMRKREELFLKVALYRHKSQWWVHHGLPTPYEE